MEAPYSTIERDTLEDDDLAELLNAAYAEDGSEPDIDTIIKELPEWEAWYAEQSGGR